MLATLGLLSVWMQQGGVCMPCGTVPCRGKGSWYRVQHTCVTTSSSKLPGRVGYASQSIMLTHLYDLQCQSKL